MCRHFSYFVLVVVVFLTTTCLLGQNAYPTVNLNTFKWGVTDENCQIILEPKYDYCLPFKSGRAIVKSGEFYGLIDTLGVELLQPIYGTIQKANDSLLVLKQGSKYGIVNTELNEVMPFVFTHLQVVGNWLIVSNGKQQGLIDLEGNIVLPFEFDQIIPEKSNFGKAYFDSTGIKVRVDGKYGWVNQNRTYVLPIIFSSLVKNDENTFIAEDNNGRFGLINLKRDTLIPFGEYDDLKVIASDLMSASKAGKYGFINKHKAEVIPFQYAEGLSFQGQYATVKQNEYWGLIDKSNKVVLPFEYKRPVLFRNGYALLERFSGDSSAFAFIDNNLNRITEFEYSETFNFVQGLAAVRKGSNWGMIDSDGQVVIPIVYDEVMRKKDYIVVKKNFKQGLYRIDGECVLLPRYSFVYPPNDDPFILVRQGRAYGYVDHKGEVVIPIKYANARNFEGDRATVLYKGESYEINRQGKRYCQGS